MLKKSGFFLFFLIYCTIISFAQNAFLTGEQLFVENKPREAAPYLERALSEDPAHIKAALYLGIVYQQLDRYDDAISVYRKVLPLAGNQTALVSYNLGNVYFARGSFTFAEQYYNQAIQEDPSYSSAYLNRANSKLKGGNLTAALVDYEQYLVLAPFSPQRPRIEALMAFVREEFAAEERRRILAELQAQEEAERRQRLLDEVSASLQAAAEETRGLSAGSEDVLGYEGEFELE